MNNSKNIVILISSILGFFLVFVVTSSIGRDIIGDSNYKKNVEQRVVGGEYSLISSQYADRYLGVYEQELMGNRILKVYAEYDEFFGYDVDGSELLDHIQFRFLVIELGTHNLFSEATDITIVCNNSTEYRDDNHTNFDRIYSTEVFLDAMIEDGCSSVVSVILEDRSSNLWETVSEERVDFDIDFDNIYQLVLLDGTDGEVDFSLRTGANIMVFHLLYVIPFVVLLYFVGYRRFR